MTRINLRSPQTDTRQAFALIVAMSLTALMVTLLLSTSVLLRLETAGASTTLNRVRAKEAARLALMLALGDLQKYAGPDQRVTARAEITGAGRQAGLWTGVWETDAPGNPPHWLVSGEQPDPGAITEPSVRLQAGYDHLGDGASDSVYDVPAVHVPSISLDSGEIRIAWWVSDEGVKAPIKPVKGVFEQLKEQKERTTLPDYFGYSKNTLRSAPFLHDPIFDFGALYGIRDIASSRLVDLNRATSKKQLSILLRDLEYPLRQKVASEFLHAATLENHFVLSNTKDGGLKKDLSYLKTLRSEDLTAAQLDHLYADPDGLITPDAARAVYLGAEPTAGDKADMMGMQISRGSADAVEGSRQDFSILPVITEFQLSAGIAADDQTEPGALYLVHKLYLELWNPYNVPFVIGKNDLAAENGYSDLRVEVSGLPDYSISNNTTGESVPGELPDLSYRLSRDSGEQTMRPGMVFFTTMPRDNAGTESAGTFHSPLGTALSGSNSDGYTGAFIMREPVQIRIVALNSEGIEKEIYKFELGGYPDFEIDYASSQRGSWFHRRKDSKDGQFGMNNESLERPGYAFGFRFKILDSQTSETMATDLSNWLSLQDPRRRKLSIDLPTWDINAAWVDPDTPPYDFRLSSHDYDPGFFDPGESFKGDDFFHYQTYGTGRKDRIARVFNVATIEPARLNLLNSLYFADKGPNPVGSPWGEKINQVFDRYFFSTLPDPSFGPIHPGSKPLLNGRLQVHGSAATLDGVDTARDLILKNGFNLNSTSALAWEKVLRGHKIAGGESRMRYEQGNFSDAPEWFSPPETMENVFFKFPESAAFNSTERAVDPRYELLLRRAAKNYDDRFRIDSNSLHSNRQHPAFLQSFRELNEEIPQKLGAAIVEELRDFYDEAGRPPFSLSEYVSSGLLQKAINATPEINQRSRGFDQIPTHGPTSIDQRTLMNALSGFASVRSDTFEIIARADVTDPDTGAVVESSICRATVQRLPEAHVNPKYGRKLEILRMEWLPPESNQAP